MVCTFFGHRDTPPAIKPVLQQAILDLIEQKGIDRFYIGNQGNYDAMAQSILSEFEQSHGIRYTVVLAYLPKKDSLPYDAEHTVLPEGIETVPPRFSIEYRNKWMIERSDYVVTYVCRSFGGAAKFKKIATRKKKTIIELSGNELISD
jgi:hypothetical protein